MLTEFLARQLREPSGWFGRVLVRALNLRNEPMLRMAVSLLEVRDGQTGLDIGFGGGAMMRLMLERNRAGRVIGVEMSEEMVKAARRQFAREIEAGRVEIHQGTIDALPLDDASVDAAVTTNTIYFWPDPEAAVLEVFRVMKPGGRFVIGFHPPEAIAKNPVTQHGFTFYRTPEVVALLKNAGFEDVGAHQRKGRAGLFVCALGVRGD